MAIPRTTNRWMVIGIVAMVANIALATAVIATHRFKDVPSSDIFHGDITWLADNDITRGCNPPANDRFCPDDNVTRGQMAAFMHRYARAFGTAGFFEKGLIDILQPAPTWTEVGSITVDSKASAEVILNGNVSAGGPGNVAIWVSIRVGSCQGGEEIAFAETFKANGTESLALSARETIPGPTTFKLCAGASENQSFGMRTLTAFWLPAG